MAKIREVLDTRQVTHGSFEDSAKTVQRIKYIMHSGPNWQKLEPAQQEALEMIQHKIGRILHGDHKLLDSHRDIVGYAQLMCNMLEAKDGTTDVQSRNITLVDGEWTLS